MIKLYLLIFEEVKVFMINFNNFLEDILGICI